MTIPFLEQRRTWSVFLIFLRLGLTSFGGPVAHLGYFRDEFVVRRRWLSERAYADMLALCHFLPGPASSQLGMALGMTRAGYAGMLAAWAGFTLPSAAAMILFGLSVGHGEGLLPAGLMQGLKLVAVAMVAQAVWGMGRSLCRGALRLAIMLAAACIVLFFSSAWAQLVVIAAGGLIGWIGIRPALGHGSDVLPPTIGRRSGAVWLGLFFVLLAGLPVLAEMQPDRTWAVIDAFYRVGALVFGGGHVVLPMLQAEVMPPGWTDSATFLAGYGAAQALPGPLFTFAAFLGTVMDAGPGDVLGGVMCLVAIFLPSFLLVAGVLPFWSSLQRNYGMQVALGGINAAVVGLLLAALFDPLWKDTIHDGWDMALTFLAFASLTAWKLPPWLVVLFGGMAGWAVHLL
ncbi:chromate transporter [Oxalicibacterium flavum]|uniref:Chromate transporter n=1 Tax=Oxalicibacterium flavum TaxID=179467 RepID=A0A8J2UMY5_9BURK|nr:chromate efflux transporter [Oxalicibacterium flavum]GGC10004.1 chromate transporter [Oxalicibacterium flavum]